ncbi:enoyl-CoA hydratase/isomerase family protein [Streptomyces sp. NPDC051985]|uniref:enoyl-CoA hydratase/isomerase family protein n=1 Tax=Streptomyces sp. NPDC051985 TaxID=3155807 RepID=UPI003448B164
MSHLSEYQDKFECIRLERDEQGILLVTLHREGKALRWGRDSHLEISQAWGFIASDPDNRVVILTGTGEDFLRFEYGTFGPPITGGSSHGHSAQSWDPVMAAEHNLMTDQLSVPVPVISAVNGPCPVHADIPLLADIVLAAPTASFADESHFWTLGTVPGDGVHVVWPNLLGPNRGRYFLLAGSHIHADEALRLGLVGEVVEADALLDRAYELARKIAGYPAMNVRYTRDLLTRRLRRTMQEELDYGLALQGLAYVAKAERMRDAGEHMDG